VAKVLTQLHPKALAVASLQGSVEVQSSDWVSAEGAIRILVKQSAGSCSAWSKLGYFQAEPIRDHYRSREDGRRIEFDLDDILQLSEVAP
jgi:hypothetical protein